MKRETPVTLAIELCDRELESEQLEYRTRQLMNELKKIECVSVKLVRDINPPTGHKSIESIGGVLVGMLKAEVNLENAKKAIAFLQGYFIGKPDRPIKVKAEVKGQKVEIEASNISDFKEALGEMNNFFEKLLAEG